ARSALPTLRQLLESENHSHRRAAAEALLEIDPESEAGTVAATYAADYGQEQVASDRAGLLWKLGQMGPRAAPAVPVLALALHDKDQRVRKEAVDALISVGGKEAAAALPDLVAALQDEDEGVRRRAAAALGSLGDRATASRLAEALNDE